MQRECVQPWQRFSKENVSAKAGNSHVTREGSEFSGIYGAATSAHISTVTHAATLPREET